MSFVTATSFDPTQVLILSGTQSAILNAESGDSESYNSNRATPRSRHKKSFGSWEYVEHITIGDCEALGLETPGFIKLPTPPLCMGENVLLAVFAHFGRILGLKLDIKIFHFSLKSSLFGV